MTFDEWLSSAMRAAAQRKLAENEAAEELDRIPHDVVALTCLRRAREADNDNADKEALARAYAETLEQLGMRIDANGRWRITRPPACGHRPNERNVGRDYPTCDGCRRV